MEYYLKCLQFMLVDIDNLRGSHILQLEEKLNLQNQTGVRKWLVWIEKH